MKAQFLKLSYRMNNPERFIVIDDDLANNMVCRFVINGTAGELEIQTFLAAEKGFEFIVKEYANNENEISTVLFLDINMPAWSGWDFLENFDKLDERIKKQIKIYMLSSSVDIKDIERAKSNPNVIDYIVKPLNMKVVSDIIVNQN